MPPLTVPAEPSASRSTRPDGWLSALPRPLRAAAIRLTRRIETTPPPRRGRGSAAAVGFLSLSLLAGAAVGGHIPSMMATIGAAVGLETADIVLTGQVETGEVDVVDALALGGLPSLLGYDVAAARDRLIALPWVRDAAVRKTWPGRLTVALVERRPAAVWQHEERLTVVDEAGKAITAFGIDDLLSDRFAGLPHLVGGGAAARAGHILPLVARHPVIARAATSFVHVGGRRWDVVLTSGVRVRLPEADPAEALERLVALDRDTALLARDIASVDLRLEDRTVVRLNAKAAQLRAELVKARAKAMRKADRKS